jgi:hypothetical protein
VYLGFRQTSPNPTVEMVKQAPLFFYMVCRLWLFAWVFDHPDKPNPRSGDGTRLDALFFYL